jgi:hypothetical protein
VNTPAWIAVCWLALALGFVVGWLARRATRPDPDPPAHRWPAEGELVDYAGTGTAAEVAAWPPEVAQPAQYTYPRGRHHEDTSQFPAITEDTPDPRPAPYARLRATAPGTDELPHPSRRVDDAPGEPLRPPRPGGRRRSDDPRMSRRESREIRDTGYLPRYAAGAPSPAEPAAADPADPSSSSSSSSSSNDDGPPAPKG